MRHAIVENGVVVNVIVGAIPGAIPCSMNVGPGWTYDGEAFFPPQPQETEPEGPPTVEEIRAARQSAFRAESDPLFFKWQAGEAFEADWRAKREEIRARYPYPEDTS